MTTATVKYLGNLRNECTHTPSGATVITDAPKDNGGEGRAFGPTDLCATMLAACGMTIMAKTAEVHKINIEGMNATVDKAMSADPRRISKIVVKVHIPQACTEKEMTLLRRAADTCPMFLSLHPDMEKGFEITCG